MLREAVTRILRQLLERLSGSQDDFYSTILGEESVTLRYSRTRLTGMLRNFEAVRGTKGQLRKVHLQVVRLITARLWARKVLLCFASTPGKDVCCDIVRL